MPVPEPWYSPDEQDARLLEAEARREIAAGHELQGSDLVATARCAGCDNAVFRCSDDSFAMVHLTWSQQSETPPWPHTVRLGSFLAVELAMDQHEH